MKNKIIGAAATILLFALPLATTAADLVKARATNETGRTRIVFEFDELPPEWDFEYNKKEKAINLVLTDTVNRNTKPVLADQRGGILKGISFIQEGEHLIIEMKMREEVQHQLTTLRKPSRLVLDAFAKHYRPESKVTRELSANINWQHVTKVEPRGRLNYHVLEASPQSVAALALTVKRPIKVLEATKKTDAIAAVNGAAGKLPAIYREGKWNHFPKEIQGGLAYHAGEGYRIIRLDPAEMKQELILDGKKFPISGFNRYRGADELIVYTPDYGESTGTNRFGTELTLRAGRVKQKANTGDVRIPSDGIIVSGHGKYEKILAEVPVGASAKYPREYFPADADFVYGGGEIIVYGGKNITDKKEADADPAPRTVLGTKADGTLLLLVADGYQPESRGLTRYECAEIMRKAGADAAMVIPDAGGATMVVEGKMVNSPQPQSSKGKKFNSLFLLYR